MHAMLTGPFRLFMRFRQSIAYLPSQLALIYLVLGVIAVGPRVPEAALPEALEWLGFKEPETARALLSTLIAGMISMMVFSFSMVMTVLSQAGGNFSHKLVFGLITERHHQRVLGHYLGTILFILILLMVPFKGETPSLWRSMGTYLGVAMVIHCLALFVYFIHNASQSVQINAILQGLHQATRHSLQRLETLQERSHWQYRERLPVATHGHWIQARQSGYIQNADLEALAKLADRHGACIHLNFTFGDYTVEAFPLFRIDIAQPSEAFDEAVLGELVYVQGESVKDLYINGLTQLMEIAIKALSPGINDPGTARLCLHQLTELLCRRLKLVPCNTLTNAEGRALVTWEIESFDSLLYRLFSPILHYGRDDVSICLALLKALKTLSLFAEDKEHAAIQAHADRVVLALETAAKDALDRHFITTRLQAGDHRLVLPALLSAPSE
ncbi:MULTISPECIES: DUF2254 domain-containing protein [Modicisalibacter]|uniref:DUF2254 domain-containing protein n=1 Tax=Modicisalibacter TaxID=574347 RepID=UPI00100AB093|nr:MULTISPECIES: DUF2254 domain-containing protein [Halomonadaceae]MBZ9557649.1 DUF2254 domain-containing protein [Modicisalibacter sp. R2A 31.J]MBZ9573687.1 DUF2254 domain-containing protein [Modicisalibacter sp. MOD 31.J]